MIKLEVPLTIQDKNSMDCGPACLHMLLNYNKQNIGLTRIKDTIQRDKKGRVSILELGIFLKSIKQNPIITLMNYKYFKEAKDTDLSSVKPKDEIDKKFLYNLKEYLKKGNEIQIKSINSALIEEYISDKKPVVTLVSVSYLRKKILQEQRFHFIIITGFDEDNFYYNDSHWALGGRNKKISKDNLLTAIRRTRFPGVLING